VEYFDERFTTSEADELLGAAKLTKKQRQARRDQLAAQIILTAYLEAGGRGQDNLRGIE
jgi:putative Holliday junction resolvase